MKHSTKQQMYIILLWIAVFILSMFYKMPEGHSQTSHTIIVEGVAMVDECERVSFTYTEEVKGIYSLSYMGEELNVYVVMEDQWDDEIQEYKFFSDYELIGYGYLEDGVIIFENLEGGYFSPPQTFVKEIYTNKDILYIDEDDLHITSETGSINQWFTSEEAMWTFISDITAEHSSL